MTGKGHKGKSEKGDRNGERGERRKEKGKERRGGKIGTMFHTPGMYYRKNM